MTNRKTVLITGGTGFIGSLLCKSFISSNLPKKVISFSRGWDKAEKLSREINDSRFRVILGDICNHPALESACKNVDYIIHTAAMKSLVSAEYNANECKRNNIDGTENVIRVAIANNVEKVLFISSDKACNPINLYGRTKAVGESLITNANNLGSTRFATARYGNVAGSTGSVIPFFKSLMFKNSDTLPITHKDMTRFWFDENDATKYIIACLVQMIGGEVFVPKLKSSTVVNLAEAIRYYHRTNPEIVITGVRPGEKLHETMISSDEVSRTIDCGWSYIIKPFQHDWNKNWDISGKSVEFDEYTSRNAERMSIDELKSLL